MKTALALVTVALALASCEKSSGGALAPDFTLSDLGGTAVSLSGLRGKVVLLNFWFLQ